MPITVAASSVKPSVKTESRRSSSRRRRRAGRSSSSSSRAATVAGASALRSARVSSRKRSSRCSAIWLTVIALRRALASSIANGMPSRRSQICSIDGMVRVVDHEPGRTSRLAVMNSSNADGGDRERLDVPDHFVGHARAAPGSSPAPERQERRGRADRRGRRRRRRGARSCRRRSTRSASASSRAAGRLGVTVARGGKSDAGDERLGQQDAVGDRDQVDEPHAVVEPIPEVRRDLDRQPGLADPAEARATTRGASSTADSQISRISSVRPTNDDSGVGRLPTRPCVGVGRSGVGVEGGPLSPVRSCCSSCRSWPEGSMPSSEPSRIRRSP